MLLFGWAGWCRPLMPPPLRGLYPPTLGRPCEPLAVGWTKEVAAWLGLEVGLGLGLGLWLGLGLGRGLRTNAAPAWLGLCVPLALTLPLTWLGLCGSYAPGPG